MSEIGFEVTGYTKDTIERAAKDLIQQFIGEPVDSINFTMTALPVYCIDGPDIWKAKVQYEW